MKYDFDREVNRAGTNAAKWTISVDETGIHRTEMYFGENRVLPMWVADMDFPCAQPIVDAMVARAQHGIYGYTFPGESYYRAMIGWMQRRHGWHVDPSWIMTAPSVVPTLNILARTLLTPGDKAIIQPPVYGPFTSAVQNNGGEVVHNPLIYENGGYHMDFADLEAKARDPQVKLAFLCHPHNPVGRVWTAEELTRFAEICIANNVLIISDEVHGDLVYRGVSFKPLASLRDDFAPHIITCTAPSKTFNLAGLQLSNMVIANDDLRKQIGQAMFSAGFLGTSAMSINAAEAAYNHGDEWLEQVMDYIEGNRTYMRDYLEANVPQIHVVPPEGTYLVWLDCRALELDDGELNHLMLDEARVKLEGGHAFGAGSDGFQRINIACPRSILVEALDRIRDAVAKRLRGDEAK